jgi:hypothetical protein
MKKLLIALLILVSACAFAQTRNLAGELNTVYIDGSESAVQQYPLQTLSVSTGPASTTAVTVTPLTGRTWIEFSCALATSTADATCGEIWVSVGSTTPAIGRGRAVRYDNPFRIRADDGIIFGTIASEGVSMHIIQGKY